MGYIVKPLILRGFKDKQRERTEPFIWGFLFIHYISKLLYLKTDLANFCVLPNICRPENQTIKKQISNNPSTQKNRY